MTTVLERKTRASESKWTLADLFDRFGPMPLWRIRMHPAPGTATPEHVLAAHRRDKRLCELVDGVLVEKPMGYEESSVALEIGTCS